MVDGGEFLSAVSFGSKAKGNARLQVSSMIYNEQNEI
jgi:hypothetical protein